MDTPAPITEYRDVDAVVFEGQVLSRYEPAVLRGLVRDWPAVQAARRSPEALYEYLLARVTPAPVDAVLMPPQAEGRVGYADDMAQFSFVRDRVPVARVLEQIARYSHFERHPAVAVQSAMLRECAPTFERENRLPLVGEQVAGRLWLGNEVVTPAHFDESSNVACVVGGRRRFTLLPPQQVGNLYIGPLDHAPTGTPISLVDFRRPDLQRFPRFREAQAAMRMAVLEPGDALYIPPLWFHHVESMDPFNAMVNYWWKGAPRAPREQPSAQDCLLHCLLNLRDLPAPQRAAWGAVFQHYLFDPGADPAGHLPPAWRGVLGPLEPQREQQVRAYLASKLRA